MDKTGHPTDNNEVHVNSAGILVLRLRGRQDVASARNLVESIRDYAKKQQTEGKKTLLLIDLT